jgi:hypothetical protein
MPVWCVRRPGSTDRYPRQRKEARHRGPLFVLAFVQTSPAPHGGRAQRAGKYSDRNEKLATSLSLSRRKPGPMALLPRASQAMAVPYQRPQARAAGTMDPGFRRARCVDRLLKIFAQLAACSTAVD